MGEFRFKQFSVSNTLSAMKVGTDGVLLGAWASPSSGVILDAGTGTGVIALMMAQRCPDADIMGVDIDDSSVVEAAGNFKNSPWSSRLRALKADFRTFDFKADLIITNPPFFINSLKSPQARRSDARHTDCLSQDELIDSALRVLSENGVLSLILPYSEGMKFISKCESSGLILKRRCRVFTREGDEPKRLMMEFSRNNSTPTQEEQLTIQNASGYTLQYKSLTKDFYLK